MVAAAAAWTHWVPTDTALLNALVLAAYLALFLQAGKPFFWPCLALALTQTASALVHGIPLDSLSEGPLCYLALAPALSQWPRSERALSSVLLLGELLALHAVLVFWTFRLVGGGHRVRPELSHPLLQAWLSPYYCGHYPRGAHAIGLFLNDNNLGLWCATLFVVALATERRQSGLLLLATLWSYSRGAYLGLGGGLLLLAAWKRRPRLLLSLLAVPLAYCAFATWLDWERLLHPGGAIAFPAERIAWLQRGWQVLASGSLLGCGPGSGGLVDSQWAKTAYELGWSGILAWGFWAGVTLRRRLPGLTAVLVVMGLGSIGNDILYAPVLVATLFALAGLLWQKGSPPTGDPNAECPPESGARYSPGS